MSTANCPAEDALIGSRIDGRYTVHSVLGQGGMGVVYEGVHDELGRHVAIKVLNAAWAADRTAVERFLREARTASSFSHSNIVDVSDLGRLADGRPYLVMPKISGIDLATLLADNGPQPAKRVAALLTGVASALDLVHAKGYVHRDIKPENLMYVVREDGSETVMLLDFGIASAVMSSGPRLTRQGAIFGTPHYLPPEVCAGARCDARGDVYSLAAVAFELITGELPFAADDIMQLMAQKVSYDAPMLAAVSGAAFSQELEQVIATGLARDPRYRYSRASEFVSELRASTQTAPVSWRSGVVRPSTRSAEHVLPQTPARPGWDVERAPTWPDSGRPPAPTPMGMSAEPSFDDGSSYRSYPRKPTSRQPTPSRYADESSSVRRATDYGGPHPDYRDQARYTTPSGGQLRGQARTANPGVWGAHATPYPTRDTYASRAGGRDAHDPMLQMHEERTRRAPQAHRRGSIVPVLIGVAACAALGVGGVQLINHRRSASQTDSSASTHSRPSTASSRPAATARPSGAVNTEAAGRAVAPPRATNAPSAALPTPSVPVQASPAAAPTPASPGPDIVTESNTQSSGRGQSSRGAVQPSRDTHEPARGPRQQEALPEPSSDKHASARMAGGNLVGAKPSASAPPGSSFGEDALPGALPASGSSVLTVKPIEQQAPASAPPEPEAAEPQFSTEDATDFARQSSRALLRGEVTKAIELGRRATQADPSYAIAWRSLGLALERAGAADQAVAAYSEYLQRAPTGPQAEMVRARMQALSN